MFTSSQLSQKPVKVDVNSSKGSLMKKHQSKMLESQHHGEKVGNLQTVQHKQWQKQSSRGSNSGRNWEIETVKHLVLSEMERKHVSKWKAF